MPARFPSAVEASALSGRAAVVVAVRDPDEPESKSRTSIEELSRLLAGLGVSVVGTIVQRRPHRGAPAYVGEGKLRELAALTGGPGEIARGPSPARQPETEGRDRQAELVVVDDELEPGQQRNLERATAVPVLDRTQVILHVFEQRARTRTAQLEVEAARLAYELPRVRDDASLGDREGGGGRGGRGHTNVELEKQRIRERLASIRRELERLATSSKLRRRRRADVFQVALVGYTNAGKSSLMRLLTGSDVFVEDRPFATLDTTVRKLAPPTKPPILLSDTVGFIDRLPHDLVASFRSTLEEALEAWLLLVVVDASDPAFREQLRVTQAALADIGATETPTWVVMNKVDRLGPDERRALAEEFPEALQVSALREEDGIALHERITAFFDRFLVTRTFEIPYARAHALADVRDRIRVLEESYASAITLTARGTPEVLSRLEKLVHDEPMRSTPNR
ncbi:MAG: GTPase HflX [Pseudomonadota bacterium]